MKGLAAAFRPDNLKAFFLDHAEKVVLGLMALIALVVLATTDWKRYPRDPSEFVDKAAKNRKDIDIKTWPESEREKFAVTSFTSRTDQLLSRLDSSQYEFVGPAWYPLYKPQELAKEPEWLVIGDLIASPGIAALAKRIAGAEVDVPQDVAPSSEDEDWEEGNEDSPTEPQSKPPAPSKSALADLQTGRKAPGKGAPGGHGNPTGPPGSMMPGMGPGMAGMQGMAASVRVEGQRFVSVRGVFPLQQQIEKMQRALNLSSYNEAFNRFFLSSFVLQRQTAKPGPEPWSGEWETLDITRSIEVISESDSDPFDPVDPSILNRVISSPLPRILGASWGPHCTHPKVKNFELDEKDLARELEIERRLIEAYKKQQEELREKLPQRGGFATTQVDRRDLMQGLAGGGNMDGTFDQVARNMSTEGNVTIRATDIKSRFTARGRLLLFRYFDFTVLPGNAYRYRVKLIVDNPNYNVPPEQVVEPSIAQGQTRETGWSNISNPAVMPLGTNYYVKDVDRDPMRDAAKNASRPVASVQLFQWDAERGTWLMDLVKIKSLGQWIGETKKTLRLDLSKPALEEEKTLIAARDVLVDVMTDLELPVETHPDLNLPPETRGKVGIRDGILVLTPQGKISELSDTDSKQKEERGWTKWVDREREDYTGLKAGAAAGQAGGVGALRGGAAPTNPYEDRQKQAMQASGLKGGKANPRRLTP